MTKILEEVRQLASDAIAKKQDNAKNKYLKLIEQIKNAASLGKTTCDFLEYEIDQYSKKLLEAKGFSVWATTKTNNNMMGYNAYDNKPKAIWQVIW